MDNFFGFQSKKNLNKNIPEGYKVDGKYLWNTDEYTLIKVDGNDYLSIYFCGNEDVIIDIAEQNHLTDNMRENMGDIYIKEDGEFIKYELPEYTYITAIPKVQFINDGRLLIDNAKYIDLINLEDKNIDRYNFKVTEDAYYRTFEFDGKMLTFMKSPAVDNPNTKLYWGLVD